MADSYKDIQLRELKDMINDLQKMIKHFRQLSMLPINEKRLSPRNGIT